MACNYTLSEETNVQADTVGTNSSDEEGQKVKHRFSEPWEDSDVILVVEDEKYHVHRLILSMNSPVFKVMFKSEFKEATSNEIPLPDKKATEVLDFLKQLYVQEQQELTMTNVDHLLKLSDEYQVKAIFDPCVKFLENQPKNDKNVMKILKLASLYKLENIYQSCYSITEEMELKSILKASQEEDLDKETMANILTQRTERLETFLDKVYPQFMGLVECCLWLWYEGERLMKWCPTHFSKGQSFFNIASRMRTCKDCKQMLIEMAKRTETYDVSHFPKTGRTYGGSLYFDKQLPNIIQEFSKIKHGMNELTLSLPRSER